MQMGNPIRRRVLAPLRAGVVDADVLPVSLPVTCCFSLFSLAA